MHRRSETTTDPCWNWGRLVWILLLCSVQKKTNTTVLHIVNFLFVLSASCCLCVRLYVTLEFFVSDNEKKELLDLELWTKVVSWLLHSCCYCDSFQPLCSVFFSNTWLVTEQRGHSCHPSSPSSLLLSYCCVPSLSVVIDWCQLKPCSPTFYALCCSLAVTSCHSRHHVVVAQWHTK